jgi:fermentation-respiration switch protein FrsA (DUF1100 family)
LKNIAALVIGLGVAGCLAGCGSYSMLDQYTTAGLASSAKPAWLKNSGQASTAADSDTTASAPARGNGNSDASDSAGMSSLFARASTEKPASNPSAPDAKAAVKPVAFADAEGALPVAPPPAAAEKITEPRGRAYLFRGIAGLIYSRGVDKLTDRIKRIGLAADVETYLVWRPICEQAIRDYRRDPQPIILIGHSMGGDSALAFAEALNAENIPVSLLVTYDPSRIADDVPPNVERYINIFQSSNFMGGGNVVQGTRFHGHYASFNLKDHSELIHINIEKADRIQEQLVAKIRDLAGTPAAAEGEAVPIRLVVPAEASIELWDSGIPVAAHAGDTLKTLAATYHVPLWSLAQTNSVSDHAVLTEGQRIVVPRHLTPMAASATLTSYAPNSR